MISVEEIIDDVDFAQRFTILRSEGEFVDGVWTELEVDEISVSGVIVPTSPRDLNRLPEGDRVSAAVSFYSKKELRVTRTGNTPGTSDMIRWKGDCYKLVGVFPWGDYGYWMGIGERTRGA